jgi:lysophospholipase L1-like esterase
MKTLHPLGIFILMLLFFGCQEKTPPLRLLTLGDSYTIGESVSESERWPIQLASELSKKNIELAPTTIIAKTGWTTDELQEGINDAPLDYPYDWVSLLIGVNNQYRGGDIEKFKAEFENLLNQAVIFSGNIKEHVIVISIPDWGVMPYAADRNQEEIAFEIDNFNQAIYQICVNYNIRFVDITPLSRQVSKHPEWIASDGLHPSGIQYSKWVEELLPLFKTNQ